MRVLEGLIRVFAHVARTRHGLMLPLLFLTASACADGEAPRADIDSGTVIGHVRGDVQAFLGIPYAAPPVAAMRWRAPRPVERWDVPRRADEYGASCPQPANRMFAELAENQDEDCLYLNVWSPQDRAPTDRLPVMVWLHGGAHRSGAGSQRYYEGASLAKRDVVVVTLNYRLGLLGFFAHRAIDGGEGGNYGLLDQRAALGWVRRNIAAFGGDPDNVTVFGESAGAVDILHLLAGGDTGALFHKAIVQSGGGWAPPKNAREMRALVESGLAAIGADKHDAEALRALPATRLVDAMAKTGAGLGFGPFIDDVVVKASPNRAFAAGKAMRVPLLIGANDWEGSLLQLFPPTPAQAALAASARVKRLYAGETDDETMIRTRLFGDIGFVAPARWLARQHSRHAPVFLYHFTYVAQARRDQVPGVAHGAEIPYAFGNLEAGPILRQVATADDHAMAVKVADCWTAFARTDHPACALGEWQPYDAARDNTFVIAPESRQVDGYRAEILDGIERGFGPGALLRGRGRSR